MSNFCVFRKTISLKLSLLRGERPKSIRARPHIRLTFFQISSKSFHFWRSYCRTREDRFCPVEYLQYRLFEPGGPKKWYLSYNVIYVQAVSLFWPTLYNYATASMERIAHPVVTTAVRGSAPSAADVKSLWTVPAISGKLGQTYRRPVSATSALLYMYIFSASDVTPACVI